MWSRWWRCSISSCVLFPLLFSIFFSLPSFSSLFLFSLSLLISCLFTLASSIAFYHFSFVQSLFFFLILVTFQEDIVLRTVVAATMLPKWILCCGVYPVWFQIIAIDSKSTMSNMHSGYDKSKNLWIPLLKKSQSNGENKTYRASYLTNFPNILFIKDKNYFQSHQVSGHFYFNFYDLWIN